MMFATEPTFWSTVARCPNPDRPSWRPRPGQSIFDSLQKLGLKLESRKVPVEIIVVESANKTPSEN